MKRNHLEVSGFKFTKLEAIQEADRILSVRKAKIEKARKPFNDAVNIVTLAESQLSKLIAESTSLAMEEPNDEINGKRELVLAKIDAKEREIRGLKITLETVRREKVKAMSKCVPAWKLQAVECIGKRGGNYVFMSK